MMRICLRNTILMLAVVALCTTTITSQALAATAGPYSDDLNTKALWHLDAPFGTWFGILSMPDDVSVRGGNVYDRQLRLEQGSTSAPDATTPTYWGSISPNGSGVLQFDGVDDDATGFYTWQGDKSSVSIDISVDPQAAIAEEQGRMGLVSTTDWSLYLFKLSGITYTIFEVLDGVNTSNLIFTPNAGVFVWDDIHAEVVGDTFSLTSNGVTVNGLLDTGMRNVDPGDTNVYNSRVILGRSFAGGNYFQGLLDEVRITNVVPEPTSLSLLALGGLALLLRRRK